MLSIHSLSLLSHPPPTMAEQQNLKQTPLKWEGKATAELKGPNSDDIWPLISDFCSLHLWFPHIETCYHVSGVSGEPGLVRYCASGTDSEHDDPEKTKWAKERLVAIDPVEKWFKYEILENNAGFGSYVATFRVIDGGEEGCVIEWSYVADPVVGLTAQDFLAFVESTLVVMASRLHQALAPHELLVCD